MAETLIANAQTIYASFTDPAHAEQAAGALLDHGVFAKDISILSTVGHKEYVQGSIDFTAEGAPAPLEVIAPGTPDDYVHAIPDLTDSEPDEVTAVKGISTTTPGDAALGAANGAGIGLGIGAITALACLVVPGFGVVFGAGALATAIAGAAGATAAGAVAGGMYGYLRDQGVPIELAERYSHAYHSGDTILAVTTPSNGVSTALADDIINKYHGNEMTSI